MLVVTGNILLAWLLLALPAHPQSWSAVARHGLNRVTVSSESSATAPVTVPRGAQHAGGSGVLVSTPPVEQVLRADGGAVIVPITASGTVLQAMEQSTAHGDMAFTGKEFPGLGFFVESINGVSEDDVRHWMLYVNGTRASLGASSQYVVPTDTVLWRFEDGDITSNY